jgi:MFS family permease
MEEGNEANARVPKRNKRFYFTLIFLFFVPLLASLNSVVLASALPAITLALSAPSSQAFWCGTGFLVARTVTTPIYGGLSEAFGRKICLLSALGIFLCGGALCSAAQNIEWLVAARVVCTTLNSSLQSCNMMLIISFQILVPGCWCWWYELGRFDRSC